MMTIAIIGYGKMGKEVEAVAKERGIQIATIFREEHNAAGRGLTADALRDVDVCIDFSTPAAAMENIRAVVRAGKNLVVGTTGWYERLDDVRMLVKEANTGFLYAANFSLGVNIFLQIANEAAALVHRYSDYDVALAETHHNKKADAPSGTALALGAVMLQNVKRKTELLTHAPEGSIKPHQLHVASTRVGHVTGTHSVIFDSESDTIELTHRAKNRRGFAVGAIVAAEWLKGKTGFYTMRDVIGT